MQTVNKKNHAIVMVVVEASLENAYAVMGPPRERVPLVATDIPHQTRLSPNISRSAFSGRHTYQHSPLRIA